MRNIAKAEKKIFGKAAALPFKWRQRRSGGTIFLYDDNAGGFMGGFETKAEVDAYKRRMETAYCGSN